MAVETFSKFYLLNPVTDTNFYLPFDEGAGELSAEVEVGEYTVTTITAAVENAMNTIGTNVYTVTFDRVNRTFTISSDSAFTLLISTGSTIGVDIFGLLGFSGSDTLSAITHTSNQVAGTVFSPQFKLQDYISSDDFQEATSAAISTTANGSVEVVSFGQTQFIEASIMFSTDIEQPSTGPIRNNASGVSDLRNFMLFATKKFPMEFILDEGDLNSFENVLLESTSTNGKGVGFKLKEMFDKGLPGYFESGKLTFRKIN